jgi:hypothetical protein
VKTEVMQNLMQRMQNLMQNNAKNNAKIMQNNAGVAGRKCNRERLRPLYLGELRGSGAAFKKKILAQVNTR